MAVGAGVSYVPVADIGSSEAEFLRGIAAAFEGTSIGLLSMGKNEDSTFSIVVEHAGVMVAFTSPNPMKMKDAFIAWALNQP
jgi:hypothetical protein